MINIVQRLKGRKVPDAVKGVLTSSDRVFDFLKVTEDRFLVVTMQALMDVESAQVKSRFGWDEVSHARWDSEVGTLRIVFHQGEDLVLTPARSAQTQLHGHHPGGSQRGAGVCHPAGTAFRSES